MILWIIKIWANPLARKIVTYVAVTAAICYGLQLWGNKQWAKGEAHGRQIMAREIEEQKLAAWKAKEDAIARDAKNIASEKRAVEAAAAELSQSRVNLSRNLNNALASIQQERNKVYANVAAIRDPDLDAAIRAISAELAGATVP